MRSHSPENPTCVDTSSFSHQQMELAASKGFSVSSSIEWNNIGIHKSNNLMFSASCYFNLKWMKTVESKSITANHIPKLLFQTVEDWNCSYFQCVFIDIEIQQIPSTLRSVACSKFGLNDRMNTNTHTYTWKPYPTGRLFPTILTRHVLQFGCQNSVHTLVSFYRKNFLVFALSFLPVYMSVYYFVLLCFALLCFILRVLVYSFSKQKHKRTIGVCLHVCMRAEPIQRWCVRLHSYEFDSSQ